ncbi:hypothetical protein GCM10023084_07730 [Streptomyces lacrimifluminis]|uniref:Uncharacterized protein n=1 Tax=Streptomyces lacrimifluminis TaxID=1500077 RepID=A0A917NT24_9ACTN|nr:hypothetical protein GCM10012282_22150 [Streptomyces lacrimifluminis]
MVPRALFGLATVGPLVDACTTCHGVSGCREIAQPVRPSHPSGPESQRVAPPELPHVPKCRGTIGSYLKFHWSPHTAKGRTTHIGRPALAWSVA